MPFTFLPHQAAVLPLKLARPRWFSGTALVFGSMAPDLPYFIFGRSLRDLGHSLPGQLLFCLPAALFLTWVFRRWLARPLALHLPEGGEYHLREYHLLGGGMDGRYAAFAAPSALVGSLSHIVWDSFTHASGWAARHLEFPLWPVAEIGGHTLHAYQLMQHGSTLVGGAATLWMLRTIGRRRLLREWAGEVRECELGATPASRRALLGSLLVAVAAGPLIGILENEVVPADSWLIYAARIFFRSVSVLFAGLCLGCILAERRMARPE
jgi:hypothetical protein